MASVFACERDFTIFLVKIETVIFAPRKLYNMIESVVQKDKKPQFGIQKLPNLYCSKVIVAQVARDVTISYWFFFNLEFCSPLS